MADENKHGLKRSSLTSEQKRQIRQQAGFGCVVCGNAIGDYEHIDPEFADAFVHDPEKMAFLCIQCHGKVTRGHLSKATVSLARQKPRARQQGFSFEAFDVGSTPPKIHFGPMSATNCRWAITVNSRPVFWINPPEEQGGPFRLNAELRDKAGKVLFGIIDNEWRTRADNWDAEVVGKTITLRSGVGNVVLRIRTVPPTDLYIEKMDMSVEGFQIYCDGKRFSITTPSGYLAEAQNLEFDGCETAVKLDQTGIAFGHGGGSVLLTGRFGPSAPKRPIDSGIRRNAVCPCGSAKRYKHCCGSFA